MGNLIFDDDFYVNRTSELDISTAKNNIELFIKNMHHSIKKNVDSLKDQEYPDPVWQGVILGEYKFRFTSASSAGLFLINSHYIAYTVNEVALNAGAVINQFGYEFFGNEISVTIDKNLNALVIETPKSRVLIGQNSPTLEKDYQVIKHLLESNHKNFHNLNDDPNRQRRNVQRNNAGKEINEKRNKPENSRHTDSVIDEEQDKPESSKVSVSNIADTAKETTKNINDESDNLDKVSKEEKYNRYEAVDPRFKTNRYIISNNYIPEGFIFKKPIVVASVQGPGFSNFTNPSSGYLKVHDKCLNLIIEKIDKGEIDAVFNLKYSVNNIQGNYEIVMFGDGVAFDYMN